MTHFSFVSFFLICSFKIIAFFRVTFRLSRRTIFVFNSFQAMCSIVNIPGMHNAWTLYLSTFMPKYGDRRFL
jgi:hypothetical protein